MGAKVIEMYRPQVRQMKASQAVKRLQELIDLHGDLIVDGLPDIQFWPKGKEGPAFYFV